MLHGAGLVMRILCPQCGHAFENPYADKSIQPREENPDYITVTIGPNSNEWYVLKVRFYKVIDAYQPLHKGIRVFPSKSKATAEAERWAREEGLEYRA